MATGAVWQAILRINDRGARATINNVGDAAREMGNQMGGNLMKATSAFSLMKFGIDVCVDSAKKLIDESKELISTSRRFDIPIEKIGGMKRMAEASGSSIGQLGGAYKELEMNINNAIMRPGKGAARTFEKLGLTPEEIEALGSDTDAAFMIMVERLRDIGDEGERAAAAQDAFGGNAQEALNYVKMSDEQLKTARDGAHKYSNSLTQANSDIVDAFADIGEAIKPTGQFIASVFGVLVQLLNMAIQGVKSLGMVIMDLISGVLSRFGGVIQMIVAGVVAGLQLIYYKGKNALGIMSDEEYNAKKRSIELDLEAESDRVEKKFKKDWFDDEKYAKQNRNMHNATLKFEKSIHAVGESIGMAGYDEGSKAELEALKKKRQALRDITDDKRKAIMEMRRNKDWDGAAAEQKALNVIEEDLGAVGVEIGELEKRMREAGVEGTAKKGTKKYKSNELEDMAEADRLKKQELMYQRRRQEAPLEFRDAVELQILTEKRITAEKELAAITEENNKNKKTSNTDIARQYELQNKLLEAQNAEMKQIKDMSDYALKTEIMRKEALRERRNKAIDAIQEREQFAMQKSGTSAVDRQTVTLNNKIEELKRAKEEFDEKSIRGKQIYTAEQKEAAFLKMQEKAFAAAKELDKLMAMQFNFTASDAAQKGMGGGIVEQKNLIEVNKDQLKFLEKIYYAVLESNGISGKPFQYEPLRLRGKTL